MSNPNVRHLGSVTDLWGVPVSVGVDYAAVTIGPYTLDAAQQEAFAQAYVAKCHEAKALAAARKQAREEALEHAEAARGVSADA